MADSTIIVVNKEDVDVMLMFSLLEQGAEDVAEEYQEENLEHEKRDAGLTKEGPSHVMDGGIAAMEATFTGFGVAVELHLCQIRPEGRD